jgi:formate dehydrogenase subunit delta
MNTDYLIKMANEISDFFIGESGAEAAPKEVATHMTKYWDPRMRTLHEPTPAAHSMRRG